MTPGKLTAIGVAVVMATALATGLVLARWTGVGLGGRREEDRRPRSAVPSDRAEPIPAAMEAATRPPATPGAGRWYDTSKSFWGGS
jgi:hypothetical protein